MPKIPEDVTWRPPEFPRLDAAKELIIDVETYDPDLKEKGPGVRRDGYIVGVSVATEDRSWYFPLHHDHPDKYDPSGFNMPRETVFRWARKELCRPGVPKIGANLLYDLDYLWEAGVEVPGPYYDILIAEPLIDENQFKFSLGDCARKYLDKGKREEQLYAWLAAAYGGKPNRTAQAKNIYRAPPEIVAEYAMGDVEQPRDILAKQREIIANEELGAVWDVESRLLPMMLAMRRRGVGVDVPAAKALDAELMEAAGKLRKSTEAAGIDIWAADSIAAWCKKNDVSHGFTPTGKPSFTTAFLEKHPQQMLRDIFTLRKLDKHSGTFINGAILGNEINGRIHCQFHQLKSDQYGTVSGRFSSSNPNLQNIPARDEELGPRIRGLFIPDEGEDWYSDDWSQIEFRMLVHYAFEQYGQHYPGSPADVICQQFRTDPTTDFHKFVSELTGIERKPAKNINFGLVYGMGEPTMAANLGRSLEDVKPLFTQYHSRLPFIKDIYDECDRRAGHRKWIKTYLGRRRRWNRYESTNWGQSREEGSFTEAVAREKYGERGYRVANTHKALNALLQGSAADIMKIAMVKIWETAGIIDILGAPLLTVHDELNWSVPRTLEAQQAHEEARLIMENCAPLNLPILCDSDHGANWGAAK
jgi:DNA polymerase I-like protein with 3'-5' exonuclease and polymerase domains